MMPLSLHLALCQGIHHLLTHAPLESQFIPAAVAAFSEALALAERDADAARDFLPFAHHFTDVHAHFNPGCEAAVGSLQERIGAFLKKGEPK